MASRPPTAGFETLAWELSTRLAARGHDVTVYCRRGWTDETVPVPPGVRRRFLPYLPGKYPATVSHTALSVLDSLLRGYDAIWLGNAANALLAGLPRLRGTVVALNVDGIERQRAKWGPAGRLWYAAGERLALVFPNVIVSDAKVIQDYYLERYGRRSALIAYGAPILERDPPPDLAAHGLAGIEPGRYVLYVSRLEPENQADVVIAAYRARTGRHPAPRRRRRPACGGATRRGSASSRPPTRGSAWRAPSTGTATATSNVRRWRTSRRRPSAARTRR